MKKLFTAVMMLVASLSAMATDYPGTLAVIIDGNVADPTATQITLDKQDDGKYTLSLKNFILIQGEDMMPVGNIVLKDVVAAEENGVVTLETVQDILIEEGDLAYIPMWLGPLLGPVPVELKATLNGEILSADIDIPLVSLGQIIKVVFDSRTFQLPNSGFEEFHTATATKLLGGTVTSDEPNNWHSFMSCAGSLASMVSGIPHTFISEDVRPGSTGSKSVLVKSGYAIGTIVANGTLTTGQLNAGDMDAASEKNNAFLDFSNSAADANGDPFFTVLNTLPDSISVWVKFQQGEAVPAHPYATMTAVITDGSYYQEPQDKDYSDILVAEARNSQIESTGEWQKLVVPFSYLNADKAPKGILVTFSTNADAGEGTGSDELYIDDVELIYSSYLSSLSVNGKPLAGFAADKYEYDLGEISVEEAERLSEAVSCTTTGKDAKVFVTVGEDIVSILVLSADMLSNRTYTIKFSSTTTGIVNVDSAPAAKADGKYLEDDQIVIYRNGVKYNAAGTVIR